MKKEKNIKKRILLIILVIIFVIVLDTILAFSLNQKPFLSIKNSLGDNQNYVFKGILIDTYYCTNAKEKVNIVKRLKWEKYSCPLQPMVIDDFNLIEDTNTKLFKYYTYKDINIYLVNATELEIKTNNTLINLSDYINENNQSFEKSIESILNKLTYTTGFYDGGTTIYKNDEITLIKCNKHQEVGYIKDIYIGNSTMEINNRCN